jgi:hypothetical protein
LISRDEIDGDSFKLALLKYCLRLSDYRRTWSLMSIAKRSNGCAMRRAVVSLLLVGAVLFSLALAASPELHRYFHSDADDAGHHCAATTLSHGHVDSPTIDSGISVPVFAFYTIAPLWISVSTMTDYSLPPDRGPPALI